MWKIKNDIGRIRTCAGKPNGFQVHRLNHSATISSLHTSASIFFHSKMTKFQRLLFWTGMTVCAKYHERHNWCLFLFIYWRGMITMTVFSRKGYLWVLIIYKIIIIYNLSKFNKRLWKIGWMKGDLGRIKTDLFILWMKSSHIYSKMKSTKFITCNFSLNNSAKSTLSSISQPTWLTNSLGRTSTIFRIGIR